MILARVGIDVDETALCLDESVRAERWQPLLCMPPGMVLRSAWDCLDRGPVTCRPRCRWVSSV